MIAGQSEEPEHKANTERSRACSPVATPTCGEDETGVVIIPKGMSARETGESGAISSQDLGAIVLTFDEALCCHGQLHSFAREGWNF